MPFTVEMTGTNEISPAVLQTLGASFNVPLQNRLYDQISLTQMANSTDQTQFKYGRVNKIALTNGLPILQEYEDPDSTPLTGGSTVFDAVEMGVVVTTTARAEAISGGNLGRQAAALVGLNAAETLDLYAASVLAGGTNAIFAGSAGTLAGVGAGDIMSPALMNRAYARLAKNRATKNADGTFNAMLTTDQILDLKNNSAPGSWVDVNKYARPEEIMSGEVGRAFGFRVLEVNILPTLDGGVDVSQAVFFGANALGQGVTVAPRLGINFTDKMNRFAHYSWYANMVMGIIDQSSVFVVNTATTVVA